ncbi:MAG: UTP--glucose-1-phosphate uridylyltransferase, partial [Spirochaetales bacterium]|nr:UTP--glucose-1-phosphate uridylyltransferase [Spirochaetales bacterium]
MKKNKAVNPDLNEKMLSRLKKQGIDVNLTLSILGNYNAGKYDRFTPVEVKDLPAIDGETIYDITDDVSFVMDRKDAEKALAYEGVKSLQVLNTIQAGNDRIEFNRQSLTRIGMSLYPLLSYGILNGGSASSYVDKKKNRDYNPQLFSLYESEFIKFEKIARNKAKGIVPAYINSNGLCGASFMELKLRSILIEIVKYQQLFEKKEKPLWPCFQMTSIYNDEEIHQSLKRYAGSPYLKDLIRETGVNVLDMRSRIQPLIAAYTHSCEGKPRKIFFEAFGKKQNPLPMPGGHGQNFAVLKEIYRELYAMGKRYIYLGNVDNLGYTINPVCLALLALTGRQGAFEFAYRTRVDIKGGILVIDRDDRINCVDIGSGITREEIIRVENKGKKILFNCATGLFNLEYLTNNIDDIITNLPMRFSDQHKDAGKYSQAEQITWEI